MLKVPRSEGEADKGSSGQGELLPAVLENRHSAKHLLLQKPYKSQDREWLPPFKWFVEISKRVKDSPGNWTPG